MGQKQYLDFFDFPEVASPASPTAGWRRFFAKSDGLYGKSSAGVETLLGGGSALRDYYDIISYGGAKGDGRTVTDGATSTNTSLTSATAAFTAADVGKVVRINRGSTTVMPLSTTVASVTNGTTAVLAQAADFTVSGVQLIVNGRRVNDGAMTAGSTTLTSATAAFVAGDVGTEALVTNAGANAHVTTIASVTNSTTVVLTAASTRTITGSTVLIASDDTTAIQNCLNAANTAGGGRVYVPEGTFAAGDLTIYSNTIIEGVGYGSTLQFIGQSTKTYLLSTHSGSGGSASKSGNMKNVRFFNLRFSGPISSVGFAQSSHLLNLNATSDALVFGCWFDGWLSDAIYIGSGNTSAIERHNERISILNSTFDGINKNNRNCISVIDGEDITVQFCTFRRSTRTDMPGAFDIEPNAISATYPITKNIKVFDNTFDDIGRGIAGVISVILKTAQSSLTVPARGFYFARNQFTNCAASPLFLQNQQGTPSYSVTPNDIYFTDNLCFNKSDGYPFEIDKGLRGIFISRNVFERAWGGAQIGYSGVIYNLTLDNNIFRESGFGDGYGLTVYQTHTLTIADNAFIAIGTQTAGPGYIVNLAYTGSAGSDTNTSLLRNRVVQGTNNPTTKFIHKHASHTVTNFTSDYNQDLGLPEDIVPISVTAVIERIEPGIKGAIAVAPGKHRYYLEGNYAFESMRTAVDTAPTGATLIVDVNKNGTTIYTTQSARPTIAISGNTATGNSPAITSFAAGDYITFDVDQVGSTVAGADLVCTLRLRRLP